MNPENACLDCGQNIHSFGRCEPCQCKHNKLVLEVESLLRGLEPEKLITLELKQLLTILSNLLYEETN